MFPISVQPATRAVKFGTSKPDINGAFIAPSATVIGKVKIGSNSSVWYGAIIRGGQVLIYCDLQIYQIIYSPCYYVKAMSIQLLLAILSV